MKHCFMNETEGFTSEVDLGNGANAVLRDLTDDDLDVISQKSGMRLVNTVFLKDPDKVEQYWELHELKMRNYKILLALGGNIGDKSYKLSGEGFFFEGEEIVLDYVKVNSFTPTVKKKLLERIVERETFWKDNLEGISKN